MARNRRSATNERKERANVLPRQREQIYDAEYAGYLVCDLTAENEKQLEKQAISVPDLFSWMGEMVDSGLKLVVVPSRDGASFRAELHDMDSTSDFAGWRLSAFAEDYHSALLVLYFKHVSILSGDWSGAARERASRRFG